MAIGASKNKYVYTDDSGKNWLINIAEDKVLGVTPNTALAAYDPASPPTGGIAGVLNPKRCRRVHAQGKYGTSPNQIEIKRDFICEIGSALYALNASQTVSYTPQGEAAGTAITMITTGRRGERITF